MAAAISTFTCALVKTKSLSGRLAIPLPHGNVLRQQQRTLIAMTYRFHFFTSYESKDGQMVKQCKSEDMSKPASCPNRTTSIQIYCHNAGCGIKFSSKRRLHSSTWTSSVSWIVPESLSMLLKSLPRFRRKYTLCKFPKRLHSGDRLLVDNITYLGGL